MIGHPFVVKIVCVNQNAAMFFNTKDEAEKGLQQVFAAVINKTYVVDYGDYVIAIDGFMSARIVEKPSDGSD